MPIKKKTKISIEKLIEKLSKEQISIYDAVEQVRLSPNFYKESLIKNLSNRNSPFSRLFCAWSLGQIRDQSDFSALKKAYFIETESNARANMVWAMFRINPKKISYSLLKSFLSDDYFLIRIIALKRLPFLSIHHRKLDFLEYYKKTNHLFEKIELLRDIVYFKYNDSQIIKHLRKKLIKTKTLALKLELINALGLVNLPLSLTVLIEYYKKNISEFETNSAIAFHFVSAVSTLCESKAFTLLESIYFKHKSLLIKLKIIEVLNVSGGPNSLKVLEKIEAKEENKQLLKYIKKLSQTLYITKIT